MNMRRAAMATIFLAIALAAAPAVAQETPQDPFKALQAKTTLTDEDRGALREWINTHIAAVVGNDPVAAATAVRELREGVNGSPAFADVYRQSATDAIGSAYKKAEPIPAARLLVLLTTFNDITPLPVFIEALQDERAGVREAAVRGLRTPRPRIAAAGAETFNRVLTALVEAGKRETATVPLESIYQAMDYGSGSANPPDARALVTALLNLIEARAGQYAAGEVKAEAGDAEGLGVMGQHRSNLNEDERKRYITAISQMLRHAIGRYTSGEQPLHRVRDDGSKQSVLLRNRTERLIYVGENELVALLNPPDKPQVAERMQSSGAAAPVDMRIEWNQKWVPLLQQAAGQDFAVAETPTANAAGGPGGGTANP